MKIGIYGGAFNPIHFGHIEVARVACEKLKLDKLIFLPSGNPVHRSICGSTGKDRYEMVELAIEESGHPKFFVSPFEINISTPMPTVETLKKFNIWWGNRNELYFIIGSDQARVFDTWQKPKECLSLAKFVVATRRNMSSDGHESMIKMEVKDMNLAGTLIRNAIDYGFPISGMVPRSVEKYIEMKGLYKKGE